MTIGEPFGVCDLTFGFGQGSVDPQAIMACSSANNPLHRNLWDG